MPRQATSLQATASMPNVFETDWPYKTLAKADRLMVPAATKHRRALWARASMPVWLNPTVVNSNIENEPWWLLQKGQVLHVLARPTKHMDRSWVPVQFKDGECQGWILAEHAYACPRHRALKKPAPASKPKPRPARLSDLRPGVVFEYREQMAIVQSWTTNRLPTPKELACVRIEQEHGEREVWLSELQTP